MSESNSEKIQRFIEVNQSMIETATSITDENQKDQSIHTKVLLCCIFDSLAKSRFPNGMSNGERFKRTVAECSNWIDRDRVSLLHLIRAFEVAGTVPPEFEVLHEWAKAEFSNKFPLKKRLFGNEIRISTDPLLQVVQTNWPTDENGKFKCLGSVQIKYLLHKHLLWLYRNRLVHEYRIPGLGAESPVRREDDPYYQELSTGIFQDTGISRIHSHWELVYPTGFFQQITKTALTNIAEFHKQNETSPFAAYSEGNYWIPEFNEE